jgi:23S rRNA pseudouridine1911/1915/1917 synthase
MASAKQAIDYSASIPAPSLPSMPDTLRAEVPDDLAGRRVDQALARLFPDYSRSRLQAWLKSGRITVDGAPVQASAKVWGGERIALVPEPDPAGPAIAQDIALPIVHEDDGIVVIDKPAGLVVHPGSGNRDGTLMNALLHHAPQLARLPRAGIVHRLDKDTSGLMVVAKSLEAQTSLVRQLQARAVRREYLAVVAGIPAREGQVRVPIGRHPVHRTRMAVVETGKEAATHYRVLRHGKGWSLVACRLETGRTHQIRVHMAAIGHPLLGDPVYLPSPVARTLPAFARGFPRQALHATRLTLLHPVTGRSCTWASALPADIAALVAELDRHAGAA